MNHNADSLQKVINIARRFTAVSQLHARFPGFVFTPIGVPQTFYDAGRLAWGHGPVGEPPKVTGLDVVSVRDGRIVALYAFIDTPVS